MNSFTHIFTGKDMNALNFQQQNRYRQYVGSLYQVEGPEAFDAVDSFSVSDLEQNVAVQQSLAAQLPDALPDRKKSI